MTTAIGVVCPRCNIADFVYFRCTTCKYFAIHQPETPDLVPRRLYGVMSPHPLYLRQGSWQGAVPATTTHTCPTPKPHTTSPQPTTVHTPNGWIHDVTSDGDVEPNPGPSPLAPSAKRTRYNQDTPLTYQTPRMLRKRTKNNSPPEQKRRRTDDLHTVYREHQSTTHTCNHHKRKAEGAPSHQPAPRRHMGTAHWDEQHPLEIEETYAQSEHRRTSRNMSRMTHRTKRSAQHNVYAPAPTQDQRTGSKTRLKTETRSPTRDQPHPR